LLQLFVAALLVRMLVAVAIFGFHGQDFFGGDAITYDFFGNAQMLGWAGDKYFQAIANQFVRSGEGSGWEWFTWLPLSTEPLGQHARSAAMDSVFGAATAVVIFLCAQHVFHNFRVARIRQHSRRLFIHRSCCGRRKGSKMVLLFSFWRWLFWPR